MLVVRKENEQSHSDFRVWRSVVQDAVMYLIKNNKYYKANGIHLIQEALHQKMET